MVLGLFTLPAKIGLPILAAWSAKEDLLDLFVLARTYPYRQVISHQLNRFYASRADSDLAELERFAIMRQAEVSLRSAFAGLAYSVYRRENRV